MIATKQPVALIAPAGETRGALASYLRSAGFEVHECEELEVSSAFAALVVISPQVASSSELVASVRFWMKLGKTKRVVIVTSKPTALTELVASYGERLRVLPAPSFGWDLVDALRANEPHRA